MYCSTCGGAVAHGLSFCNYCGAKLGGAKAESVIKSTEVKPELLVSAMVGAFVLGLVAIAVLVGVLKAVGGFDTPILYGFTMFSFVLLLVVEGVLIGLLLKGKRGAGEAGDAELPKGQTTQGLGESQARALPEPVPSVTEHTTRLFEPVYGERRSE